MVRAWYMDEEKTDQRLEHHRNPPKFIEFDELFKKTGLEYVQLNADTYKTDGTLDKIRKDRGYSYEDEIICCKEFLPDYENKLKNFYTEHFHPDEEIRFFIEGSGYFDVRDADDEWIRIEIVPGALIIIPKGLYHRFTLDYNNYTKYKRYFCGEPVWVAYNRPS